MLSNASHATALSDALSALPRGWPDDLLIRPCRRSDAPALWSLFNEDSYQRSGTLLDQFATEDDVTNWLDGNRSGNFEVVALAGGLVVGFAGLYPLRGRQGHTGFVSLGVRADHRRCGYGRALLRIVLATADHLAGLSRVQLYVLTENIPAIALYESCGFRIEGRHAAFARRDHADGTRDHVDALSMARVLPASSVPLARA